MNAILAFAVDDCSGCSDAILERGVMIEKQMMQPIRLYIRRGRLPALSSNIVPVIDATKQSGAFMPLRSSFRLSEVIPAFSSMTGR